MSTSFGHKLVYSHLCKEKWHLILNKQCPNVISMQNNNVTQVLIFENFVRRMSVFDNDKDHIELGPSKEFDNSVVFFYNTMENLTRGFEQIPSPINNEEKGDWVKRHNG